MTESMSEEELLATFSEQMQNNTEEKNSYADNLALLGGDDLNVTSQINIYFSDFSAKDEVASITDSINMIS